MCKQLSTFVHGVYSTLDLSVSGGDRGWFRGPWTVCLAFASHGSARETVGETYLIVLILLGHGLLLGLSFAFVPMVLEPDLHLQREGRVEVELVIWMEGDLLEFHR